MKSLIVLTCLVAVCFTATNAASIDTRALRNLLLKVLDKRSGDSVKCAANGDCGPNQVCEFDSSETVGECEDVCTAEEIAACPADTECEIDSGEVKCEPVCSAAEIAACQAYEECEIEDNGTAVCEPHDCDPTATNSCLGGASCVAEADSSADADPTSGECQIVAKKRSLVNDLKNLVKKWEKQ